MSERMVCPYCGLPAKLVDSEIIYNGRSFGNAWVCSNYPECDAYVGCHRDDPGKPSNRAKGNPRERGTAGVAQTSAQGLRPPVERRRGEAA